MLEQSHKIRTLNVIVVLPSTESITQSLIPVDLIEGPVSLNVNNDIGMCEYPDLEWCRGVVGIVKSMEYKKEILFEKLNLDCLPILNEDVKVLSNILISIVPRFVEFHIPRNQLKLYPGVH